MSDDTTTEAEADISRLDQLLDKFYAETRIWPPGRSIPMAGSYSRGTGEHVALQAWDAWVQKEHKLTTLRNSHAALVTALDKISTGTRAFSLDPLIHASNCIDNMKEIARDALAEAEEVANG